MLYLLLELFILPCYSIGGGVDLTIGEQIKEVRKKAGLTQKELGERLGVSYQSIAQWENNLRKPKYDTLKRIAEALDVSPMDLLVDGTPVEFQGQLFRAVIPPNPDKNSFESSSRVRIIAALDQMDDVGQKKVADYAEDILPTHRKQQ